MKCKNCGSTIREGASFCLNCGAQVQAKKKGSAQGGVKALIIVLVCSLVLLSGVAAYAIRERPRAGKGRPGSRDRARSDDRPRDRAHH